MKQIILFLGLILSIEGFSQGKEVVTKYDNGKIYETGYINDKGLKDGSWIGYYEDGSVWAKAAYYNGLKDGIWRVYKPDGELYSEVEYRRGKKLCGRLYENGKVVEKKIFEDYLNNE